MGFVREGRTGLLGAVTRADVVAGTPSMTAMATTRDLVSELAELAKLRDSGVLTEPEFQAVKTRILTP